MKGKEKTNFRTSLQWSFYIFKLNASFIFIKQITEYEYLYIFFYVNAKNKIILYRCLLLHRCIFVFKTNNAQQIITIHNNNNNK